MNTNYLKTKIIHLLTLVSVSLIGCYDSFKSDSENIFENFSSSDGTSSFSERASYAGSSNSNTQTKESNGTGFFDSTSSGMSESDYYESFDPLSQSNFDESKIREYCTLLNEVNNAEKFLYFTDTHLMATYGYYQDRALEFIEIIERAYNSAPFNFAVCGGDWLGSQGTQDEALYNLGYIKGLVNSKFRNGYLVLGNHDTNYLGKIDEESDENTGILSQDTLNNILFSDTETHKSYYSFKHGITRGYVFDTGTDLSPNMTDYSWDQVDWFANKLLENDDDYSIMLVHILANKDLTSILCHVAYAYNQKTTIIKNGITYDFSKTKGQVKCLIAGHDHEDRNGLKQGIPYFVTTWAQDSGFPTFDMCLLDYDKNVASLVRYGTGSNRKISLTTGQIIE